MSIDLSRKRKFDFDSQEICQNMKRRPQNLSISIDDSFMMHLDDPKSSESNLHPNPLKELSSSSSSSYAGPWMILNTNNNSNPSSTSNNHLHTNTCTLQNLGFNPSPTQFNVLQSAPYSPVNHSHSHSHQSRCVSITKMTETCLF